MNKIRSLLVIGSKGQLGAEMCIEAKKAGYEVREVDFPEIDITDYHSVKQIVVAVGPDAIINCAAYTAVDECETNIEKAFSVNAEGAGYVASASASIGARIVHISTDYVFDGENDGFYVETDTPNPLSIYGKSKLEGEKKVAEGCENHQIFRIAWLYGLYGKNFVFTIRKAARQKVLSAEPLRVVDDQLGSPTSTKEVCRQVLRALPADLTGVFHSTCEGWCSWYDFAKEIVKAAGIAVDVQPCTTAEYPRPARRPRNSRLENHRLKSAGIAVMTDWKSAFYEFLREEAILREEQCTK